jgi:Lrp/AsnC family transcriptional regulator for asnA, asnC and gidA
MYSEVVEHLRQIPEIVFVHYTTGNYSLFAQIICRDTKHLRVVLHDKIQMIPGISRTETSISLEESVQRGVRLDVS